VIHSLRGRLAVSIVAAAVCVACGDASSDETVPVAQAAAAPEASAEPPAADDRALEQPVASPVEQGGEAQPAEGDLLDAPSATPTPVVTYGVAECDKYVKKYLTCIETRVPADQRQGWLATFETNRAKWKGLAAMREGKLALGLACKSALEMSKQALAVDFGCEF
jgi:hypothetical protein